MLISILVFELFDYCELFYAIQNILRIFHLFLSTRVNVIQYLSILLPCFSSCSLFLVISHEYRSIFYSFPGNVDLNGNVS